MTTRQTVPNPIELSTMPWARAKKFKDAADYLEYLQREEADYLREDFQFGARDESLVTERDRSRAKALQAERDAAAAERRRQQEADSHPY